MSDDTLPESDVVEGFLHPRMTPEIFGHKAAEDQFLQLWNAKRLHHAILLHGPRGIGKATLAWRLTRFLLDPPDGPADQISIDWETGPNRRISALSEPRILLARRNWDEKTKKLRSQIVVDDMRDLKGFFNFAATEGGWRVAIIDAADDMNIAAANAVLKILEEPPARTVIFLISHQPSRLLPTIRSRCLSMGLNPLSATDLEAALRQQNVMIQPGMEGLSQMAGGSIGQALRLIEVDGPAIYTAITHLFSGGTADRSQAIKLAEACLGPNNALKYEMTIELIGLFLSRLAKQGATGTGDITELVQGEARVLNRLSSTAHDARKWAALGMELPAKAARARAVNLDPASVILDMLLEVEKASHQ